MTYYIVKNTEYYTIFDTWDMAFTYFLGVVCKYLDNTDNLSDIIKWCKEDYRRTNKISCFNGEIELVNAKFHTTS